MPNNLDEIEALLKDLRKYKGDRRLSAIQPQLDAEEKLVALVPALCQEIRELRAELAQARGEKGEILYAIFYNGELLYEDGMRLTEEWAIRDAEKGYDDQWADLQENGYSCRPVVVKEQARQ